MLWSFDGEDMDDDGVTGMSLETTTTTTTTVVTTSVKKKEKPRLQPPMLRRNKRKLITEETPYTEVMMDRVSQQQKRERKKKNRQRRRNRKKKNSRAKGEPTTTNTVKKTLIKKKPPRRSSANGDSSDSDEAIERLEKRSRPKDTKRRKIVTTPTPTTVVDKEQLKVKKPTIPKKNNSKKKRPRTVPGFLPVKDDGYAGFGPALISTFPEAAVAYDSQRKQALTALAATTTTSTTTSISIPKLDLKAEESAELINIVKAIDFERTSGTIAGMPIRMPATAILAHFVKNRRESLQKSRQRAAECLANQIDEDLVASAAAATVAKVGVKIKIEKGTAAVAQKKQQVKKKVTKKKPPKTVLDTPLDEFQAFFLLGRNLYTKIGVAIQQMKAAEMVHSDGHPDFAHRASIATELIAEQEFRDRTYRDPMSELAVEMMMSKRRQEGKKDGNLDVPDSIALAINTLKLQNLGAGCTRLYCAQFLREPLWDERPCVNGDLCVGMKLPMMCPEITSTTKTEACIILREFYTPDEMSDYHRTGHWPDEEHRRCCLLCSRFRITKAFFSYHARGVSPEESWIKVAQVQDHWNVVGEGEGYTPDETLQILSSKTGNWELSPFPVVMFNPSNLRAATMEIQPHQGRMVAIIEGTKKRIEMSVPADHPLHSQYFYHEGEDLTREEGLKKHIVGCFVEKGQDFQSASTTSGQQSC